MTDCIEPQLLFSFYPKQKLLLRFDGGEMTSDAGLLLLRQFDQRHGLTAALAEVLTDERREASVDHVLPALLRQRIYQSWLDTKAATTPIACATTPPFSCWPCAHRANCWPHSPPSAAGKTASPCAIGWP